MSGLETVHSTLQPVTVQEWVGASYTDIPFIPGLDIDAAQYRYVSQGFEREVLADEAVKSLGSDGFSFCSGLVLTDPEAGSITMAHLEPHSEAIINHLDQRHSDRVRQVALFYGSLSVRQSELEHLVSTNYFGPMQLHPHILRVETLTGVWFLIVGAAK